MYHNAAGCVKPFRQKSYLWQTAPALPFRRRLWYNGVLSGLPLGAHPAKEATPKPTPITASTLSALLSAALAQKPTRPLVLALDGRCGSGKTTLANGLSAQLPGCTLLRTDDFYLPPARRSPDWAHTPCANMDLTRLRDETLRPAYAGQPVAYRAYSCREGAYLPPAQLPAQPLVILEGSYSHHPLLRPYETLRVFVTCTKAEQTRRLQAREGARYADFAARWVPLEEGYFAQYGVAESADFVVETTK